MTLKIWQLISIVLAAFVAGMFHGPWVALTRSLRRFEPELFLAIVRRLNQNMAPIMTVLMPAALLSIVPVLYLTHRVHPGTFYLNLTGFVLFLLALLVTVIVEVPIVKQIESWKVATLPANWQHMRDRWGAFHVVRIVAALAGLVVLVAGVIW